VKPSGLLGACLSEGHAQQDEKTNAEHNGWLYLSSPGSLQAGAAKAAHRHATQEAYRVESKNAERSPFFPWLALERNFLTQTSKCRSSRSSHLQSSYALSCECDDHTGAGHSHPPTTSTMFSGTDCILYEITFQQSPRSISDSV
jgi:hypothetical protein